MSQQLVTDLKIPAWCSEEYVTQTAQLQSELKQLTESLRVTNVRISCITNVFDFCSKADSLLDLTNADAASNVATVLKVFGFTEGEKSSDEEVLKLKDEFENQLLLYVVTGETPPQRKHFSGLVKAQTEEWLSTGTEPRSAILFDEELTGPLTDELKEFAKKKSVLVLDTKRVRRLVAEILINESDPDDVRLSLLSDASLS